MALFNQKSFKAGEQVGFHNDGSCTASLSFSYDWFQRGADQVCFDFGMADDYSDDVDFFWDGSLVHNMLPSLGRKKMRGNGRYSYAFDPREVPAEQAIEVLRILNAAHNGYYNGGIRTLKDYSGWDSLTHDAQVAILLAWPDFNTSDYVPVIYHLPKRVFDGVKMPTGDTWYFSQSLHNLSSTTYNTRHAGSLLPLARGQFNKGVLPPLSEQGYAKNSTLVNEYIDQRKIGVRQTHKFIKFYGDNDFLTVNHPICFYGEDYSQGPELVCNNSGLRRGQGPLRDVVEWFAGQPEFCKVVAPVVPTESVPEVVKPKRVYKRKPKVATGE